MKKIVVGILAHVDSGKTTLSEALLYQSGNISKIGRVDNRDSFLDTFSLERAILVVSGTEGVQSHTKTLWKLLAKYNVPCFIFVNKMDLAGANKGIAMAKLKSKLSDNCVDFDTVDTDEFYENIALCDEDLLVKYEEGNLQKSHIVKAIKDRKIFPCMFGAALKLKGTEEFLDCIYNYSEMNSYGDEFAGKVYKIAEDKGQRLTYLKVTGGTLKVKEILQSPKNKEQEKVQQIRIYSGESLLLSKRLLQVQFVQ